jgi:hypothetical protein
MELCVFVKVSFICNPCLLKLCMWNRSRVFSDWPFFSMCSISKVWSTVPYVCPVSSICCAYFEFCLYLWPGYAFYIGL